jgi:hypothetical protein
MQQSPQLYQPQFNPRLHQQMQPPPTIPQSHNIEFPNDGPKNVSNENQSCFRKYYEYLISIAIFCWLILSIINVGTGITYMNTPICTKTNVIINNSISNNQNIPLNNTYITKIQEITPTINLSLWLIINGFVWQYLIIISIIYYIIGNNSNRSTCFGHIGFGLRNFYPYLIVLSIVFMFCWLIIGCKSIWTDCGYDITKNPAIEGWMTLTLIGEILGLVGSILWLSRRLLLHICG